MTLDKVAVRVGTRPLTRWLPIPLALLGIGGFALFEMQVNYHLADYATYEAAGWRLLAGDPLYAAWQAEPYLLPEAAWGRGFVYPPTAAVLLLPAGLMPSWAWQALNLSALLGVAALLLGRRALWGVAGLMLFVPTWAGISLGQVAPLLAAGMGLAFWRPRWAWWIAGIGGAIKLFPLVLLVVAWRYGGWRHVAYGLALLLGIVAVTWPLVGHEWPSYVEAMRNASPICNVTGPTQSITCIAGQPVAYAVGALLGVGALALPRLMPFLLSLAVWAVAPDIPSAYYLIPAMGLLGTLYLWRPPAGDDAVQRRSSAVARGWHERIGQRMGGRLQLGERR